MVSKRTSAEDPTLCGKRNSMPRPLRNNKIDQAETQSRIRSIQFWLSVHNLAQSAVCPVSPPSLCSEIGTCIAVTKILFDLHYAIYLDRHLFSLSLFFCLPTHFISTFVQFHFSGFDHQQTSLSCRTPNQLTQ